MLRLVLGLAVLTAWGQVAQASPLDDVEVVIGGPVISDDVLVGLSSVGISFGGGPTGFAVGGTLPGLVPGLLTSGSLAVAGGSFLGGAVTVFDTLGGMAFLTGSYLDARFSMGVLDILFSVDGGTGASAFGSAVRFSLASPSFDASSLSSLPLPPNVNQVPAVLSAYSVVLVPAPAALPLLLSGLGLFWIARRATRRQEMPEVQVG